MEKQLFLGQMEGKLDRNKASHASAKKVIQPMFGFFG
jgi:hypothetical protein